MNNTFESWTKEEFLTYLMLYAANIDGHISAKEQKIMGCKVGETVFEKMREQFETDSDYESLQNIIAYKNNYLQSENALADMLAEVKNIFFADKVFSEYERQVALLIEKLLK
ncbi:MAG: TerB family tellurite resistance protein [Prevotellaceae bacterium]|jgi:thiosulfate/3-mercaptopyruvate sulfurtransferase|nr:TerB family tellurite resistance protein [Prevotellaceae bacterium]